MTKRHNRKCRISRAIGTPLWGASNDPATSRAYPPGMHGIKGYKKRSEHGRQLQEKQKLKFFYGDITEKQFKKFFKEAARRKGDTGENFLRLLESRLDALVYRASFARTPFASRQLVNHGHITVNGKVVNIPSYIVKPGDIIEVKEASKNLIVIEEALQTSGRVIPAYITVEDQSKRATYVRLPETSEIDYPAGVQVAKVVEFYSK